MFSIHQFEFLKKPPSNTHSLSLSPLWLRILIYLHIFLQLGKITNVPCTFLLHFLTHSFHSLIYCISYFFRYIKNTTLSSCLKYSHNSITGFLFNEPYIFVSFPLRTCNQFSKATTIPLFIYFLFFFTFAHMSRVLSF